jgi:hypothetical protein
MPERKGRRRRPERRRREVSGGDAHTVPQPPAARAAAAGQPALPSKNARATGLLVAIITAFLSLLMIVDGAGTGGSEGTARIVAGALLVVLSLVVGALSLFPAQISRAVRGRG